MCSMRPQAELTRSSQALPFLYLTASQPIPATFIHLLQGNKWVLTRSGVIMLQCLASKPGC